MFWPCCSPFSFKALLYFRHLYYFSWDHVFRALLFIQSALIIVFGATITLGALLFYLERFYLLGALLFFLQSAFLFLHSAFLMLHSAFLKFSVWVSTCIFSLIVSQRAILFLWCSYYFSPLVWSAYLLINEWDFWWYYVY